MCSYITKVALPIQYMLLCGSNETTFSLTYSLFVIVMTQAEERPSTSQWPFEFNASDPDQNLDPGFRQVGTSKSRKAVGSIKAPLLKLTVTLTHTKV